MDGKPAKINTTTGAITFTNGKPISSTIGNTTSVFNTLNTNIHTVIKGETLYSISKKYQITMDQIRSLNNLETNILSVNQQLKIGFNTSSQLKEIVLYTVEKGDTLYSIARQANITIQELKQLNNLETNNISIGQRLKIK